MNIEIKMESFENDKLDDLKIKLNDTEEKETKNKEKKQEEFVIDTNRTTLYTENNSYNQTSVNMVDKNMSFTSINNNNNNNNNNNYESGGDHRSVAMLTVLFKGVGLISYLILNWLLNDDIILFILVTLL